MSGVIKSADARASGRVFAALTGQARPERREPSPQDLEIAALGRELESLRKNLAEREAEIVRLAEARERAFDEGQSKGHEAGLAERDERRAQSLARLEQGIIQALARFTHDLTSLERLAAVLARESLARILDDHDRHAELLGQIIGRQAAALDAQAIVRVEVAREDFADPDALSTLAEATGRPGLDIQARDGLPPGGCRIKLRLGTVEIGIDQQWGQLKALLDAMSEPETGS